MAEDRLNPGNKSAAESDYDKKFNRSHGAPDTKDLKQQEAAGSDAKWKTTAVKKNKQEPAKKGRFRFAGRHGGKLRQGSAFAFILGMLTLGVWYTSVFAPNILLVNIKEMYTNDLSDATIALNTYYWKMMNYKIGRSQCGDKEHIKCRLSTMSRAQKQAFEKQGFTVIGTKVEEDNKDDFQEGNDKPEQRYQVTAILPPAYTNIISGLASRGMALPSNLFGGDISNLGSKVSGELNSLIKEQTDSFSDPAQYMPIATGDMLWLYTQISSASKALVYNVFNPKSSFFQDTRFKQRIQSKYGLTKSITTGGATEQGVNKSFDASVRDSGGGFDLFARPDPQNGISLGSLSNPVTAVQLLAAMQPLAAQTYSYVGLQCAWYSFGKAVTNAAKVAKHATVARFAMQYLKAADQIKLGTSDAVTINTLSSKLAQSTFGGYSSGNAADSSMYKSIVYGNLPIPSIFGLLYYLDTFDLIAAMIPAWSQIMATAAAQGVASNVTGSLAMPPANLTGSDREYCLGGETLDNHAAIKKDTDTACIPQIEASAPLGFQGAVTGAIEVARETCPPPHFDQKEYRFRGEYIMQPSLKTTSTTLSSYVAGLFSVNVIAWANVIQLLFTSQTKGVAASDAIFAGTGEILGDMAQSRGMMPSNIAFMTEYLAQKESVQKEFDEVARYNARQNPLDIYNKFSFAGSLIRGLTPTTDDKAPLFSTISNFVNILGTSVKRLDPSAEAFYYSQPIIPEVDPLNPAQTGALRATGLATYMTRFHCPDPEYLAILITADAACNVRYSLSRAELAAQPDQVIDYMTKTHNDAYQDKIDELMERQATADTEGDAQNIARMIAVYEAVAQQPFIDEKTGKAIPNSEYDKFLDYCVNRQDPWGRSAIHVYKGAPLTDEEKRKRHSDKTENLEGISPNGEGNPYEERRLYSVMSITEGAKADQDWYTGKKCTEMSEMLTNFRAYTMMCSVDGSLSGGIDCTDIDNSSIAAYSTPYLTSNDILYTNG